MVWIIVMVTFFEGVLKRKSGFCGSIPEIYVFVTKIIDILSVRDYYVYKERATAHNVRFSSLSKLLNQSILEPAKVTRIG